MPAITFWSVSTVLIRPLLWVNNSASPVASTPNASGPSPAMPGTFAGSSTSHTARRFWVPASVRSNPHPSPPARSPRCTRSAMGPFPGFNGAGLSLSDQRSQPARDRWVTRCSPPASTPRNLPQRWAAVTVRPCSADGAGSNVFSADSDAISTRSTARPTAHRRRWSASASTSGNSGNRASAQGAFGAAERQ